MQDVAMQASLHDTGNASNPVELLSDSSSDEEEEVQQQQQQQQQEHHNDSDDSSSDEGPVVSDKNNSVFQETAGPVHNEAPEESHHQPQPTEKRASLVGVPDHVPTTTKKWNPTPATAPEQGTATDSSTRDAVSLSPLSFQGLPVHEALQQQSLLKKPPPIVRQKDTQQEGKCQRRNKKRTLEESSWTAEVVVEHPAGAAPAEKNKVARQPPGAIPDDGNTAEDFLQSLTNYLLKSARHFVGERMPLSDFRHIKNIPPDNIRKVGQAVGECLNSLLRGDASWNDSASGLDEDTMSLDDGELADDDASIETTPGDMEEEIEEEEKSSKIPSSQADKHVVAAQDHFEEQRQSYGNGCTEDASSELQECLNKAISTTSTTQGASDESISTDKHNLQNNSSEPVLDSGNESSDPYESSDEEFMPSGNPAIASLAAGRGSSINNAFFKHDEECKIDEACFGFCCARCRCKASNKCLDFHCIEDDREVLHRPCCHNITLEKNNKIELHTERLKALDQMIRKGLLKKETLPALQSNKLELIRRTRRQPKPIDRKTLKDKFDAARLKVKRIANMAFEPTTEAMAFTDPQYVKNVEFLRKLEVKARANGKMQGVTVLDCFSGIGTLLVALKRLAITVNKYIYNEYDPHAKHVFRSNHDRDYNPTLINCAASIKINFVYDFQRFEDIVNNLDAFMEQYAPIDFVGAGPPCQSFTQINAHRKGVIDEEGQLFVMFAKLVKAIQEHPLQKGKPVFFFAENVELRKDDLAVVEKEFNCPRLILDAMEWSPCSRRRMFFTNLLVPKSNPDWECIDARACLKDGWELPGHVFLSDHGYGVKANTFMASLGRIDDKRMMVVKKDNSNRYQKRTLSVVEREKMMGYPKRYVERPVKELFEALLPAVAEKDDYNWSKHLDKKYHDFSGRKLFKLNGLGFYTRGDSGEANMDDPCFELKLAPPQTGIRPTYFDADGYAKHLVGNAYSVPVVVELLRCIKELFDSAHYRGYEYSYEWEK